MPYIVEVIFRLKRAIIGTEMSKFEFHNPKVQIDFIFKEVVIVLDSLFNEYFRFYSRLLWEES